jgi:hypothetical protein
MTTAFTVLAFTVVLAEMFAAVGLSTVVPAAFAELVSILKKGSIAGVTLTAAQLSQIMAVLQKLVPPIPGLPAPPDPSDSDAVTEYNNAIQPVMNAIKGALTSADKLQLLAPKAATIDASFECGGSESYAETMGVEGVIQVVGVKAGFSAMFELHSSTTLKLHVEFAPVEYTI